MTILGTIDNKRVLPESMPRRAGLAMSYRAARRAEARRRKLIWRMLPHLVSATGSCVVALPPW